MSECGFENCRRQSMALGYCDTHYRRVRREKVASLYVVTCPECGQTAGLCKETSDAFGILATHTCERR